MTPDTDRLPVPKPWVSAAHIFALSGFAVTQPLFDLLGRNPTFFVAHRVTGQEVLLLLVFVAAGVPGVLIAVEIGFRWLVPHAVRWVHAGIIGGLGAVVALTMLERVVALPWLAVPLIVCIATVGLARMYQHVGGMRSFLTALTPAPLVFVVLFVGVSPARAVVFPQRDESAGAAGVRPVPIFFLVFDGLPVGHLMNGEGKIAEARFPNFARLSRISTWYRNATTVHTHTHKSVPAILSGRFPDEDGVPTLDHYPDNLFTLLQSTHKLHVDEKVTKLCPPDTCDEPPRAGEGMRALLLDSSLAYLHVSVPRSWRSGLPAVDDRWGGFTEAPPDPDVPTTPDCKPDPSGVTRNFEEWLSGSWSGEPPTLHYLHLMFPHDPWRYLPTGQTYSGKAVPGFGESASYWGNSESLVDRALQQFSLQVGYADTLVGRLLDHLQEEDLLDRSVVVVTSDHGMGFTPGEPRRRLNDAIFEETARVPLFLKVPRQQRGELVDDNVETIDILPTMADVLGFDLLPTVDGQSTLTPDRSKPAVKRSAGGTPQRDYPGELNEDFPVGAKMDRLFGEATDQRSLYSQGPNRDLVGQRVNAHVIDRSAPWEASVAQAAAFGDVDPTSPCVPARLDGSLRPGHQGTVAVALNGIIAGVGSTYATRTTESSFIVMVRPDLLRQGRNDVSLFVVHDAAGQRVLQPVTLGP